MAANAIDATDAANLMMALGIHPCQEVKDAPLLIGVTHYLSRITHRPTPAGSARDDETIIALQAHMGSQADPPRPQVSSRRARKGKD
jgi:hypothetical protein